MSNKTTNKVLVSLGDLALDAVIGLADWVGLGNWIENRIKDSNKFKNKTKIIHEFQDKINEKISKGQIELAQLQEKLYQIPNVSLNLEGRAAEIARDYNNKRSKDRLAIQNEIAKKQGEHDMRTARADQLLNDLANEQSRGYVNYLAGDLSKNYEKEIGEI